ncbi:FecR family protein [Mucilaginibacter oryzae]|uniref:FecR family protein n=1 Tax=Mucilaginibacter oryzae TaxID=468058 RepID=A0A316H4U2_9SPHI|nr:FecR family protein [Mucilaginibacter oryzae]PWK75378.1 FecR family protein [Mucilaginibacter oryzae]
MSNYTNYEVEDFLHDDFFINWVLQGTAEQNAFWDEWLLNNPDRQKVVESAKQIILAVSVKPPETGLTDDEVNGIAAQVQEALHNKGPMVMKLKFYQTQWFRIAAVLTVFLTIGLVLTKVRTNQAPAGQQDNQPGGLVSVVNNTTESKLVQMSDGSLAILKPGSGIKYPRSFKGGREAFLNGEAFFEIHKNPAMPFLVHSHDMVVRVLGTSFTVRSFSIDKEFKVIVNTGKVLVYNQKQATPEAKNTVTLLPNQTATYTAKLTQVKKESLTKPLILSTPVAQKEFTFDNATLADIIDKIDIAYGVNVEYDKAVLGPIHLSASLSDRPLDEKVKLICKAVNASCQFIDGRIIITTQNLNHSTAN